MSVIILKYVHMHIDSIPLGWKANTSRSSLNTTSVGEVILLRASKVVFVTVSTMLSGATSFWRVSVTMIAASSAPDKSENITMSLG